MHDFDAYFAIRRLLDLDIRPDGAEVAYTTDTTGNFNAWRQSAGGGWPYQLTTLSERAARRVAFSPDGTQLAFTADRDGDENEQIYVMPAHGGTPRRLTQKDDAKHLLATKPWSPDGATLLCATNAHDPANFDMVALDVASGEACRLTQEALYHEAFCWSFDGRFAAGHYGLSNTHHEIVVADRETGDVRTPTLDRPASVCTPVGFSADAGALYVLTDEDREHCGLARLDLDTGALEWIKTPDWSIDFACMSADARRILYIVNEDAVHRVRVYDRNSGIEPLVPDLPMGVVQTAAISADGTKATLVHNAARHPGEVVVIDIAAKAKDTITHNMIGGITADEMVEPEIVRYPSFDRKVPAQIYCPEGAGPFPALLHIHGGPEAQEQPHYKALYQYLVSRGVLVFAPNIRGSTGYGKSYQKLILRDFGGDDLRDLEGAAKYLQSLSDVDGSRLAVAGGSYGGFASLSCATRLPQYWRAAVDVVGPSNLVTFAGSVPESWKRFMRDWVGDPEDDRDELLRRSPITYLDDLACPLLVIQGAHDPRVVKAESDQLVERVRQNGGDVEYVVYEDEGHGFLKQENQQSAFRTIADFLLRHLQ